MSDKRPLSEESEDSARRYRAYAIARRLFAAMDEMDDAIGNSSEGLQRLARDVVDAIPILFRGADGLSPHRIAVVFAEEIFRHALPSDDARFSDREKIRRAAELLEQVRQRRPLRGNLGQVVRDLRAEAERGE